MDSRLVRVLDGDEGVGERARGGKEGQRGRKGWNTGRGVQSPGSQVTISSLALCVNLNKLFLKDTASPRDLTWPLGCALA